MALLNTCFIAILIFTSIADIRRHKIPIWSLISIGFLCITKGNYNPKDFILGFLLMFSSMILADLVLDRETIGGGDLWMSAFMAQFMGFKCFLLAFIISAFIGIISILYKNRSLLILDIPYMPYLTLGASISILLGKLL